MTYVRCAIQRIPPEIQVQDCVRMFPFLLRFGEFAGAVEPLFLRAERAADIRLTGFEYYQGVMMK